MEKEGRGGHRLKQMLRETIESHWSNDKTWRNLLYTHCSPLTHTQTYTHTPSPSLSRTHTLTHTGMEAAKVKVDFRN